MLSGSLFLPRKTNDITLEAKFRPILLHELKERLMFLKERAKSEGSIRVRRSQKIDFISFIHLNMVGIEA